MGQRSLLNKRKEEFFMKDLNKKLRFPLDIQCFAESGDGGDDGAGAGGNDPQEPQMVPKTQFDRLSTELANLKKH